MMQAKRVSSQCPWRKHRAVDPYQEKTAVKESNKEAKKSLRFKYMISKVNTLYSTKD